MEALTTGADGVLVLGCAPGDCHYKTGNVEALRRMLLLERILQQYGIQKARIQFDCVSAGEGEKYARIAVDMIERLKGFGPLNYVCKA
jgi:F420-non-reducing hydrogenase iron-sulfur subunit